MQVQPQVEVVAVDEQEVAGGCKQAAAVVGGQAARRGVMAAVEVGLYAAVHATKAAALVQRRVARLEALRILVGLCRIPW
jgi:hypothetical protein